MVSAPEIDRRRQGGHAVVVEHALQLARTHGWRYAMLYLLNQGLDQATIERVLFGDSGQRRKACCPAH